MAPRRYSMERRSAKEGETRRRIVDAAVGLHGERGVLMAKPQDIAAKADVALATYYKHFPSREDLVRACITRGRERMPPPDPAVVAALPREPALRIAAMVRTLFQNYEVREPWLYTGWTEERLVPELKPVMDRLRAHRDAFVGAALEGLGAGRQAAGIVTALVDFWAWRTLRREVGLTQEEAIRGVTEAVGRTIGIAGPGGPRPAVGSP